MRRPVLPLLIAVLLVLAGFSTWPVMAQSTACQLAPVFLMMRDLIGKDRMGDCTSAVVRSDSGDFNQPTTRGMLTFRPSDLIVAFSDGQTTWLYGPNGLESRPTGTRLSWEGTGATVAAASTGSGTTSTAMSSGLPVPPPTIPTPTPNALSSLPIKLNGEESSTTKAFDLSGGDYAIGWEIERQRGKTSCYVGGRLRRSDDQNPGALILHTTLNTANDRTASGEALVFSVLPGRYVLDVDTTGCDWRFTIKLPS